MRDYIMNYWNNLGNGMKLIINIIFFVFLLPVIGLVLDAIGMDPALFVLYALYVIIFSFVLNGDKLAFLCKV